jgi:hypothetical protein
MFDSWSVDSLTRSANGEWATRTLAGAFSSQLVAFNAEPNGAIELLVVDANRVSPAADPSMVTPMKHKCPAPPRPESERWPTAASTPPSALSDQDDPAYVLLHIDPDGKISALP